MCVDVADLVGLQAPILHRQLHGVPCASAVRRGGGDVVRVRGHAVAHDLGVHLRAAPLGVLPLLEDQHGGAVAHDEPVAILVERAARGLRVVVALRQRLHVGEARDGERRDRRLRAARDHEVGFVVADQIECVAHAVGGRRARRHGAVVGPLRSVAHRDERRSDVRHVHRHEERRHPTRPLLEQGATVLLEGLEAARAGADEHAGAPQVQLIPIVHEARVGHRLLRCADRELREQVVAADFLLVQELGRVEALDLAGELHGALGRVEARDRARPRSAGDEALPGALDARPQRGHGPQTRDRHAASHPVISPSSRAGTAAPAPPCAASRPPRRGCRCRIPSRRP